MIRAIILFCFVAALISFAGCLFDSDTSLSEDEGTYTLVSKPTWLKSYGGGGGLFLIELLPDKGFSGKVRLNLYSDPDLNAELTTDCLTSDKRVTELTIRPDSMLTIDISKPISIVEHEIYIIGLISTHSERSDTLFLEAVVIKELSIKVDPARKPPVEWLENEHPDLGITLDQDWFYYFAYDGNPVLDPMYPSVTGIVTWIYLSSTWEVTEHAWGWPPFPVWILLRKRGEIQPIFVAKREFGNGWTSWKEIPVDEFPFYNAFWWDYY